MERNLFGRLLCIALGKKIDIGEVLRGGGLQSSISYQSIATTIKRGRKSKRYRYFSGSACKSRTPSWKKHLDGTWTFHNKQLTLC